MKPKIDLDGATVLFVPGLRDHVEDHWQTHASRDFPGSVTVEPLRVDGLSREARVAAVKAAVNSIEGDVIIVAHSAGCLMVAHCAEDPSFKVRAALLVTPADVENALPDGYPKIADLDENGWLPIARTPLPFAAIVVASRNDPLATFDKVEQLAWEWGAELYDAGEVGHLNPAAGYGPWLVSAALLRTLVDRTRWQ